MLGAVDLQGKLQKAADMVWDLLQPVNARYQPIEVTPGGSVRLTVMQTKKSSKSSKFTTSSSAAAPDALGVSLRFDSDGARG